MNQIILCEGKTDAILLGYYMMKVCNFKYVKNKPKELKIKDNLLQNESFNYYQRDENYLSIWGVGGKNCFSQALADFYNRLKKYAENQKPYEQLIVICDRDNQGDDEITNDFNKIFKDSTITFKNKEPLICLYKDSFEKEKQLKTMALIIPDDKEGALETVLLDAIKENEYDAKIVNRCEAFVEETRSIANRYIKSDRLELKAKLSSVFAIMSPEKVFSFIDELLVTTIKWEDKESLKELFNPVVELLQE